MIDDWAMKYADGLMRAHPTGFNSIDLTEGPYFLPPDDAEEIYKALDFLMQDEDKERRLNKIYWTGYESFRSPYLQAEQYFNDRYEEDVFYQGYEAAKAEEEIMIKTRKPSFLELNKFVLEGAL